jgi:hypothetical protein
MEAYPSAIFPRSYEKVSANSEVRSHEHHEGELGKECMAQQDI